MLTYPAIDPIAFTIGPIAVHWYGLMYLLGFMLAWSLAHWRVKRYNLPWTSEQISDFIFYAAFGVVLGGRIGYMLFYAPAQWLAHPLAVFKIWEGGMSFHGGLIGALIALCYFAKKVHKSFLEVTDFVAPLTPLGLAAGRMGNFINGELWGRVTDVPWAMVFPFADDAPRHPSQLYESGLEGVLLFMIISWYASAPRPRGRVSALFLMIYALCRIAIEFFREPDPQWGYLAWNWVTMGQLLSVPMFIMGLWLWFWSTRCKPI